MSTKKEFWNKVVGESWYNFNPELWNSTYMEKVMTYISKRYKRATVYPDTQNIFRPFKLCPKDNMRVLILGDKPNTDGSATGLAFAHREDKFKMKPELKQIMDSIENSCYNGFNLSFNTDLEGWASQGVLLLNSILTIERFGEVSHESVWQDFIIQLLIKFNDIHGLHVCLWGNARKYKKYLDESKLHIYEDEYPDKLDWNCSHFKDINENIIKQNGKEEIIKW